MNPKSPFKDLIKLKRIAERMSSFSDSPQGVDALFQLSEDKGIRWSRHGNTIRVWLSGAKVSSSSAIGFTRKQALISWCAMIYKLWDRTHKVVEKLQDPKVYRRNPSKHLLEIYAELCQESGDLSEGSAAWIINRENINAIEREFKLRDKERKSK